tara:strand:- start:176456 stop:177043 length:588 start_codon:yes stop_codon:yes gene_type:complete
MAQLELIEPVVRICAVISRHESARDAAVSQLTAFWGEPLRSCEHPFAAGGFYEPSMGGDLVKRLVAFASLADPGELADWKIQTNQLEAACAADESFKESRPLNLDPGYISQAKLVLATTKDRDHRLYLRDGIFAEVTLNYMGKKWIHHRWSYPDFRTEAVADFATECRNYLRENLHRTGQFRHRSRSSGAAANDH